MSGIPAWASAYLDEQLPGNPVLNARALSGRLVLANTREGAVLVRRSLLGRVTHAFVEVPQERVAFRCGGCGHNLQFYNVALPATVFCSICAAKYHVDGQGGVTDVAGHSVAAPGKAAAACACCADGCCGEGDCCDHAACGACCEKSGCCKDGCDPATCCPEGICQCCDAVGGKGDEAPAAKETPASEPAPTLEKVTPVPPPPGTAYTHNGYTLYRRDVATKSGSRPLYFFSKGQPRTGEASALPQGHEVGVNERTGVPFLRRGASGAGEELAAAPRVGYKGDSHPVIDVEGIGPTWAERLQGCGVATTDELCRSDPQALAGRMGEAVETIRFWQQMAELMKVKGIGPQYAEALARSGVHGIEELKARKAADLVKETNAWLDAQKQTVIKTRLTPARVQGWQKAARALRKVKVAPHALS
jgi:predicted flap endonuclease-1-like 5' DNA nuclease